MPVLAPVCDQLQVGSNFFQAPAPPSHSTPLACLAFRLDQSQATSKSSNCPSLHPPNIHASIGKMPCMCSRQFMSSCKWAQTSPSHSTRLTCFLTCCLRHVPSKSSNFCSLHPPNMDASIVNLSCLCSCLFVTHFSSPHLLALTPLL
jgi:hypothetical protein